MNPPDWISDTEAVAAILDEPADDWPARLGPRPRGWDGYLPSGEEIEP